MGSTLELVFGAIPESVTTLDLSMDHSCNWMRIGSGFRAIPKSVTSLKLRGRELDYLSYLNHIVLVGLLGNIQESVTSLHLSLNELATTKALIDMPGAIPKRVTSLGLSLNSFGDRSTAKLAEALRVTPHTVTLLDLSNNNLREIDATELAEAFRAMPASVNEIILSISDIANRTDDELVVLGKSMPWVMKINMPYYMSDYMLFLFEKISLTKLRIAAGAAVRTSYIEKLKSQLIILEKQHAFQQQQSVLDQQYHYLLPTTLAVTATGISLTAVGFFANTPNDNGYVVPQNTFLRS